MRGHTLLLGFVLALFMPIGVLSQEFSLKGNLIDENNQPIPFANVILSSEKDAIIVTGASTDDIGLFEIKNIQGGNYVLKASFLGYKDAIMPLQVDGNISLGSIILIESREELSEISVVYKRPTLKREADRLVFSIANSSLSEGNMMEALRSTPGVLVIGEEISIKNTTPTVFINDRKVHLSSDELSQLLENSPANTIKSIEVITNPPAKYDAESGAVINIVMSKNLITGYRGNIFTNYTQGVYPRYNAGVTNFYKTNKINIFANYSYSDKKINRLSNENINFLDNNNQIAESWDTDLNRDQWTKNHSLNFNFDYLLDDNSTLSLSSNILVTPYFKYLNKGVTRIMANPSTSGFTTNNLTRDDKNNLGFDLDFVHRFKDAAKLSTNVHYTNYDYNRRQDVESDYYNADDSFNSSTAFNTLANQKTEIYTGQLDYELPVGETASFSTGVKASKIETLSDITQYDIINGEDILNTNNTDAFNYDENIYAGYLGFEKNWDKWMLSAGLRVEQTKIEGFSEVTNQMNSQEYLELFPTLSLTYNLSDNIDVYTTFKRSVERPDYQSLNPFRFFLNDNVIVTGNPSLRPSFVSHAVVGTSILDKFIIEAYYKKSDDSFIELPIQDNENMQFIYRPTNLSNNIEYGFDFVTMFNASDNWYIYFVTSFYNVQDEAVFGNQTITADMWSNYSVFSNDFKFLKDKSLTANFSIIYNGKTQIGFQEIDTRIVTDLSLRKSLFKKKANLSLHVADLLNKQDETVVSKYLNQDNSRFRNLDNRYVKVGFSYKFGNTTLQTNERIIEREERERIKERN